LSITQISHPSVGITWTPPQIDANLPHTSLKKRAKTGVLPRLRPATGPLVIQSRMMKQKKTTEDIEKRKGLRPECSLD